jgi:hypothetical protein
MNKESPPYRVLCTEFYDLDKPFAPEDALQCYLQYAEEAKGPILEPKEHYMKLMNRRKHEE